MYATKAMASRAASSPGTVLPDVESALRSFVSSPSRFRVVHSVNASTTMAQPRTLYILDSSFNPPSKAHFTLAASALCKHAPALPAPHRLLLLFSTHNADKAPSPAAFAQRITLMTVFAQDLAQHLKSTSTAQSGEGADVAIDIGLTKEPYYSDKSAAIQLTVPPFYSADPVHVHLVGYDTLIRLCNPKYYPTHHPPLAALAPFFEAGHRLRVTQRPADVGDEASRAFGTADEQERYLQRLRDGAEEKNGFVPAWGHCIDMAQADAGVGISSTRVREAARRGNWTVVEALCTPGVAAWLQQHSLYREDE